MRSGFPPLKSSFPGLVTTFQPLKTDFQRLNSTRHPVVYVFLTGHPEISMPRDKSSEDYGEGERSREFYVYIG